MTLGVHMGQYDPAGATPAPPIPPTSDDTRDGRVPPAPQSRLIPDWSRRRDAQLLAPRGPENEMVPEGLDPYLGVAIGTSAGFVLGLVAGLIARVA